MHEAKVSPLLLLPYLQALMQALPLSLRPDRTDIQKHPTHTKQYNQVHQASFYSPFQKSQAEFLFF